ncbi:energy transducer TonB [Novosphingobium sp. ZN18A2]|uniref:energy transducer TonB n=1 Tax=Novosphingobium sp. ZN18A2 TaxID=3079861 RepID=UPI0030D077BE
MLALPLLAAAMALVPPEPKGELVSNSNYPQWALQRDKSAGVVYTLLISPDGEIAKCMIRAKVGNDKLAGQICDMIKRRKTTLRPALASDGMTTYGVYTDTVNFFIPNTPGSDGLPIRRAPDAELTVSQMPSGLSSPADIHVAVEVGTQGTIEHCGAVGKKPDATLTALACKQLGGMQLGVMNLGTKGENVPYVRSLTVRFTTAG